MTSVVEGWKLEAVESQGDGSVVIGDMADRIPYLHSVPAKVRALSH